MGKKVSVRGPDVKKTSKGKPLSTRGRKPSTRGRKRPSTPASTKPKRPRGVRNISSLGSDKSSGDEDLPSDDYLPSDDGLGSEDSSRGAESDHEPVDSPAEGPIQAKILAVSRLIEERIKHLPGSL